MDGDDLRTLPLSMRKANLARRPDGIFVGDFEQGEIGPNLFRKACEFGLGQRHRREPPILGEPPTFGKMPIFGLIAPRRKKPRVGPMNPPPSHQPPYESNKPPYGASAEGA
jgi:hypothetical protein